MKFKIYIHVLMALLPMYISIYTKGTIEGVDGIDAGAASLGGDISASSAVISGAVKSTISAQDALANMKQALTATIAAKRDLSDAQSKLNQALASGDSTAIKTAQADVAAKQQALNDANATYTNAKNTFKQTQAGSSGSTSIPSGSLKKTSAKDSTVVDEGAGAGATLNVTGTADKSSASASSNSAPVDYSTMSPLALKINQLGLQVKLFVKQIADSVGVTVFSDVTVDDLQTQINNISDALGQAQSTAKAVQDIQSTPSNILSSYQTMLKSLGSKDLSQLTDIFGNARSGMKGSLGQNLRDLNASKQALDGLSSGSSSVNNAESSIINAKNLLKVMIAKLSIDPRLRGKNSIKMDDASYIDLNGRQVFQTSYLNPDGSYTFFDDKSGEPTCVIFPQLRADGSEMPANIDFSLPIDSRIIFNEDGTYTLVNSDGTQINISADGSKQTPVPAQASSMSSGFA